MGNENGPIESCCTGNEILCLGIPSPIDIVLLGLELQLELPCVRLTAPNPLTDGQISQLLQVLQGILAAIGNIDLSEVIGSSE
ncbi:hypothetical protein [Alkalihalophilus marmarensis]|uniref:hypothetical protein n=1 Tax=Alkalihalophilus marmarensis TaxID=521377 RepID=UPI002E1A5C87|nr:hypothetical protein [Alkalihalophilus marmarensis]